MRLTPDAQQSEFKHKQSDEYKCKGWVSPKKNSFQVVRRIE